MKPAIVKGPLRLEGDELTGPDGKRLDTHAIRRKARAEAASKGHL